MDRRAALERIRHNIERSGYHVYNVLGAATPRFLYTIGLGPEIGAELVLAGAALFSATEARAILDIVAERAMQIDGGAAIETENYGTFRLCRADSTWSKALILGALDYYQCDDLPALQVVPDASRKTIDVPDMSSPQRADPVWRWLTEDWPYLASAKSVAFAGRDVLLGARVIEVGHAAENEWEFFGQNSDEPFVTSLGTLLGSDPSLAQALELPVGSNLRRRIDDDSWYTVT